MHTKNKPQVKAKMKLKTGDKVIVLAGKDKGKKGPITASQPKAGKVTVEGINVATKHAKPRKQGDVGGILKIDMPMNVSKVQLICPKCGEPTRVGRKKLADGKGVRVCKKCGDDIE